MKIKEKCKILINIHTRVVTGIFFFICFYLFWLPGSTSIRIKDILCIQIIGLISALAYLPFLAKKEYSKTVMVILQISYFLVINLSVLAIGFVMRWFSFKIKGSIIAIELMIIAVYAITMAIFYIVDYTDASKLTKKIQERNNKNQNN